MGGKAAMVLALTEPERVRRLIVADMAPVAYGHSQIGYVRAMQAVDLAARRAAAPTPTRRLAAAVPEPGAARRSSCRASRSARRARGWKLNLAALAEEMPRIMAFPDARRPLRRPDAVPDRRAARTTSRPEHWPRIRAPVSRRRGTWRSPAPATGCTPTRRDAFVAAVAGFLDARLTPALDARRGALLCGGARRSSSAGRARHS